MAHDAPAVVLRFEVGIREADEDLLHLVFAKEVGQISHAISPVVEVKKVKRW